MYILVAIIIILLIFSPKTKSMLTGDSTTEAPEPKDEKGNK